MIIDLLHNKIVADTISEGFKRSVAEGLVPALSSVYGDRMLGIQMYEDYLADEFVLEGVFYYPMIVILEDEQVTHWISWPVGENFTDGIPYSYTGEELIEFDITPDVPLDFETAIIGRGRYCEEGLIKVNVHSTSPSPTFLAGKYSQSFIDELARQITPKICELMSVSGIAESGIELELVFAPATYMEHNSENVTYRRLLMTDKASAPRDFWVKWTNHRDNTPFTVSDSPVGDEIEFEIGEGVPQKLREKEYRYLIRTNNDKYQKAMGKRNITEWRDLIKRALRKGKLTRVVRQIPLDEETILVNEKLAGVLGLSTADVVSTVVIDTPEEDRSQDVALELARAAGLEVEDDEPMLDDEVSFGDEVDLDALVDYPEAKKDEPDDDLLLTISLAREAVANRMAEEELDLDEIDFDELPVAEDEEIEDEDYDQEPDEEIEDELEEIEDEIDLEDELGEEIDEVDFNEDVDLEDTDEADMEIELYEDEDFGEIVDEESFDDEAEDEPELDAEPEVESEAEVEPVAEDVPVVVEKVIRVNEGPSAEEIEAKLREGLEAKIRLEYEQRARETAEAEMLKLRREQEQLLIENRRLEAQAQKELEERKRISEQRKLEEARLRAQIETQVRAEAKERERLAEAARLAVEEQRRMETERLLAERQRMEEERRAAEERARAEAEARLQAERELEAERIRRASKPQVAEEEPKNDDYTYIAKTVKLLFRYSVDPNITGRIHEIIKATLEYYKKDKLHIRVRASVPDKSSVILEFVEFPKEELELLQNIIKVLGNSGIGIAKAILEDPKK